ncbi:MAG: hypothetical protein IT577_15135 [Verrucomicrobiae bacterium]|nr:hypothetical protein [Verrucomicrobiae bacterium]
MTDTKIGTVEAIELTLGSFGQQYATIDGRRFVTWFDYRDPALAGLRPGCRVEYRERPAPTPLCHAPRVTEALSGATLLRVIRTGAPAWA